jgi:hypothetical protein
VTMRTRIQTSCASEPLTGAAITVATKIVRRARSSTLLTELGALWLESSYQDGRGLASVPISYGIRWLKVYDRQHAILHRCV